MEHTPLYAWVLALTASVGIPGLAALALANGRTANYRPVTVAAVVAAALIIGSALLANGDVYRQGAEHAAPWFAAAFAATLAGALLLGQSPRIRAAWRAPGALRWLTLPHTLRIEGVVFVLLWAQGLLPAMFALPAGLGDMAIGVSAPFIARRVARGDMRGATRFHLLGILDLVVALTMGFLAGLGPIQVFNASASTLPLSQLPLALIPTVAVPIALALHLAALRHPDAATASVSRGGRRARLRVPDLVR